MTYNVHDLLRIDPAGWHTSGSVPDWAQEVVKRFPWVVVRREAPSHPGFLPVGVRGPLRSQRVAAQLAKSAILERRTSWSLAEFLPDSTHDELRASPLPCLAALPSLSILLRGWRWGVGGSVAFQLVTGMPCVTADSDIDLLLYPASTLRRRHAEELLLGIRMCFKKVDALIETTEGAYALAEYGSATRTLLCRTPNGPVLQTHPDGT